MHNSAILFKPLALPCGKELKNRIAKSAMSDSLGDGTGHPTDEQIKLYQRWAQSGLAISIIGEVQCSANYAEKPGNLVLNEYSDLTRFKLLAETGSEEGCELWLQLGHAGAMAYPPTSKAKGPSALDLPGLQCAEMSAEEIQNIPERFAITARLAKNAGFGGVQIHAAHGFLLSQFLSPLFNKRSDSYGGPIENRMKLLLESIEATRAAVGQDFPIAVKLNSSDQLEGGLAEEEALEVVKALDSSSIDLLDISGGTYFPGAKSASDSGGKGPYFLDFAKRARVLTSKPLMLTGGFKTKTQAVEALTSGAVDVIGLARLLALEPELPGLWQKGEKSEPRFPRFSETPEGGVTAWYTMRLTEIGADKGSLASEDIWQAIEDYEQRDKIRTQKWLGHFGDVD